MADTKYILDKIKIEGVLQELIAKSNGENVTVTYNGTEMTLAAALAKILADITALPTTQAMNEAIAALKQEMLGDTPVEAYDTFAELAKYIEEHQDAADALNQAIGAKADKSTVQAIQATVNALGALASKNKVSEADLDTALREKVNAASEGNHSHLNKAVLDGITAEKVAAWDGKAEKTEATTSAAGLMSAADKTRLDGLRGVRCGTTVPDDMQNGELFVKIITE